MKYQVSFRQGNMISSQLKMTRFIFHMGKDHCCYGYIINHTFQSKSSLADVFPVVASLPLTSRNKSAVRKLAFHWCVIKIKQNMAPSRNQISLLVLKIFHSISFK